MPCTKCENGKYKWGKTGECKYDSKEACEKANKKNYNKMKPTPLGKTYEQYEKELKEFNFSKVERVEFALTDDLEKADKEGRKLIEELAKEQGEVDNKYDDIKNLVSKYNTLNKNYKERIKKGKSVFKELMDNVDKVQKGIKELGVTANDVPALKSALASSSVLRSRTNDAIVYPDIKL